MDSDHNNDLNFVEFSAAMTDMFMQIGLEKRYIDRIDAATDSMGISILHSVHDLIMQKLRHYNLFKYLNAEMDFKQVLFENIFKKESWNWTEIEMDQLRLVLCPCLTSIGVPTDKQDRLIRKLHLEQFEKEEIIYDKGETPSRFYIVLTGVVGVDDMNSTSFFASSLVKPGQQFGETEFMTQTKRQHRTYAKENTQLAALDSVAVGAWLVPLLGKDLTAKAKYFENHPALQSFPKQLISGLSHIARRIPFTKNSVITQQNSLLNAHILFIWKCSVKVIREIPVELLKFKKNQSFKDYSPLLDPILLEYKVKNMHTFSFFFQ